MNPLKSMSASYRNFKQNRDLKKVDAILDRMSSIVVSRLNASNDLVPTERKAMENTIIKKINSKLSKLYGRVFSSNRSYFNDNSGYNLQRMLNAYETETFLARVVDQYIVSVLQKGWGLTSNDPEAANYIERRLFEIEQVSGKNLHNIISQSVPQILLFGNLFYTGIRDENASSGNVWTRFDGKTFKPIAALEVQDSIAMRIAFNYDKNKPMKYYQYKNSIYGDDGSRVGSGAKTKGSIKKNEQKSEWTPEDVVHVKFHGIAGKIWAMPPFQPVLEDILALRELEECIQLLVFQYGHIFLHGKVEEMDPDKKQQEIDNISMQLQRMEGNGAIVTGSETSFEAIGAEGKAIRAEAYLQYFQQRVLAGLYTSSISMGQGSTSNRNTADFVDKQKQEVTKDIQAHISNGLQYFFDQLLLEAGKNMDYVWKNRVSLRFPDPDTDSKIKLEQHAMLLYQSNCITESELREMIGKKALSEAERAELYYMMVTLDQSAKSAAIQTQNTIATTKATTSTSTKTNSNGNSKSDKSTATNKTAKQTTRPANQYGKKTGPGSIKNSATNFGDFFNWID